MPMDAFHIRTLCVELNNCLENARVDKVQMPSFDEIILSVHSDKNYKLLISANAVYPRVCFCDDTRPNPLTAPSFCMLLRKYLTGGKILSINSLSYERVIDIAILCKNELQDNITAHLIIEIMGRHSNIIFCIENNVEAVKTIDGGLTSASFEKINSLDKENKNLIQTNILPKEFSDFPEAYFIKQKKYKIVDCLKHVPLESESDRKLLPGAHYAPLIQTDKLTVTDKDALIEYFLKFDSDINGRLDKYIAARVYGISAVTASEALAVTSINNISANTIDKNAEKKKENPEDKTCVVKNKNIESEEKTNSIKNLTSSQAESLVSNLQNIWKRCNSDYSPCLVVNEESGYKDFCAYPFVLYKDRVLEKLPLPFAIDKFYSQAAENNRRQTATKHLTTIIKNTFTRNEKKLNLYKEKLTECENKDTFKLYGELLSNYIYQSKNWKKTAEVLNYYNNETISIPLKDGLSPKDNISYYFNKYNKLKKAELLTKEQIEQTLKVNEYLETISFALNVCSSKLELDEISSELAALNLIKETKSQKSKSNAKSKQPEISKFLRVNFEGFTIAVGKNNTQNDYITFKTASDYDIWFHTQKIHGSHVVILTEKKDVPENVLNKAAALAAFYSQAKQSDKVPVDYTYKKFVRKPSGSKPGFVTYTNQTTVYVKPEGS